MASFVYNSGLDLLANWETENHLFLLFSDPGYVPNRDDRFISDLAGLGGEIPPDIGYNRVGVSGAVRIVDDTNNMIRYDCDDPIFGTFTTGPISAMFLAQDFGALDRVNFVETTCGLIAYYELDAESDGINPFVVYLNSLGVGYLDSP